MPRLIRLRLRLNVQCGGDHEGAPRGGRLTINIVIKERQQQQRVALLSSPSHRPGLTSMRMRVCVCVRVCL